MTKSKSDDVVSFDVLLKSGDPHVPASAQTMEKVRPDAEASKRTLRWLEKQGIRCHDLEYSLACQAPCAVFEKLFQVALKPTKSPTAQKWEVVGTPVIPEEIAPWVDAVTVPPPVTLF